MKFGLSSRDINQIVQIISTFGEIQRAVLFGSRAKGNYKPGSDIDIAVYGDNITVHVISKLHALLEDCSPMPYMFDVIDGTHLTHAALREHIERTGQVLFDRSSGS